MKKFHKDKYYSKQSGSIAKKLLWFLSFVLLGALLAGGGVYRWYESQLRPLSNAEQQIVVTIEEGNTVTDIAVKLEDRRIIRSAKIFDLYTRINNNRSGLQAGSYKLSPDMSVQAIVAKITRGEVATDLVTILPTQRLDQIKAAFLESGYTSADIQEAFDPSMYIDHSALKDLPKDSSLEGYLYPESYQRHAATKLSEIITQALDITADSLTDERLAIYAAYGLNRHQSITMASIIEREVGNAEDRSKVAQVFLKRYREGMQLGSDPTALYGALIAGIEPSVYADTPYNTRLYDGLPPGPINNVSDRSLDALAKPAQTDYLYFVSGDDGITHFSRTLQEHEALTAQYCIELCKSY